VAGVGWRGRTEEVREIGEGIYRKSDVESNTNIRGTYECRVTYEESQRVAYEYRVTYEHKSHI